MDGSRRVAGHIVSGRDKRPPCRWAHWCGAGAGLTDLLGPSQGADIGASVAAGRGRWRTRQWTQGSRWQPDYRWLGLTGRWRRAWHARRWHDHHKDTTRFGSCGNGRHRGRRRGNKQAKAVVSANRHEGPLAGYSIRAPDVRCCGWFKPTEEDQTTPARDSNRRCRRERAGNRVRHKWLRAHDLNL
jgi:hypothetical protein